MTRILSAPARDSELSVEEVQTILDTDRRQVDSIEDVERLGEEPHHSESAGAGDLSKDLEVDIGGERRLLLDTLDTGECGVGTETIVDIVEHFEGSNTVGAVKRVGDRGETIRLVLPDRAERVLDLDNLVEPIQELFSLLSRGESRLKENSDRKGVSKQKSHIESRLVIVTQS